MSYPNFYFIDDEGELPSEDGIQHVKQYGSYWRVRVEGGWQGGVAVLGPTPLRLTSVDGVEWQLPSGLEESTATATTAGRIQVGLTDCTGNVIPGAVRFLEVEPSNLTPEQFSALIQEIGLLALNTASRTQVRVAGPVPEQHGIPSAGGVDEGTIALARSATELLSLYSVAKSLWSEFEQRPLKSFSQEIGPVRADTRSSSPQVLVQQKIQPTRRVMLGTIRSESTICPENAFLCHVLDHYLRSLATGLADLLDHSLQQAQEAQGWAAPRLPRRATEDMEHLFERTKERVARLQRVRGESLDTLRKIVGHLRECAAWATSVRRSGFLEPVSTPPEAPNPTLRLMGSATYGVLYRQFSGQTCHTLSGLREVLHLFEATQNGLVRRTRELYEIWCVVKLYATFVAELKLLPPSGEPSLFEAIRLRDGNLEIPKDQRIQLQGDLGGRKILISLWYERLLYTDTGELRTPDLFLEIQVGTQSLKFCFDAKYRNYKALGNGKLTDDVCRVARDRYLRQLRLRASFILHTDSRIDYWGEVPFSDVIQESFGDTVPPTSYVSHRYGAVCFRPGALAEKQARRLLSLLFHYHCNLRDTCLRCSRRLAHGSDIVPSWNPDRITKAELARNVLAGRNYGKPGAGAYCVCPNCANTWVVQRCYHQGDLLVKTGDACLHRRSRHPEYGAGWMYVCPSCGSDPRPEEIRRNRERWVDEDIPDPDDRYYGVNEYPAAAGSYDDPFA